MSVSRSARDLVSTGRRAAFARPHNLGRGCAIAVALATVGWLAAGCAGPDHRTLCESRERCLGGNDKDIEACVVVEELQAETADILGCTSEYEEFTTCFIEEATCTEQPDGRVCTNDAECASSGFTRCKSGFCASPRFDVTDETACEKEENAYQRCR